MSITPTPEQLFHSSFNKNISALNFARKKINSQINHCLRKDDNVSLAMYTKIYLLIYCSWSEASLVKLAHTPFGFSSAEKISILSLKDISKRWEKCVELAFAKIINNDNDIPNRQTEIYKLLNSYLKSQKEIRNKVAHGQWEYPLFGNNLSFNPDIKIEIDLVDVIQIDAWFDVFKEITEIVQGLIDARPKNNHYAHYEFYLDRLINIQAILDKKMSYTIEDKKRRLKLKPIPQFVIKPQ